MFLSLVLIANGTERGTSSKGGNTLPIRRGHGGNSKLAIRKKIRRKRCEKDNWTLQKGKKSAKKSNAQKARVNISVKKTKRMHREKWFRT